MDPVALTVGEAAPTPPPGPVRDALAAQAAGRAQRAEDAMVAAVDVYLDRVLGVVRARLRGPKARRGTRHWTPGRVNSAPKVGDAAPASTKTITGVQVKALDVDYVVPDGLIGEIVETARPVALRVARDAAADAAARLGVDVPDTSATADGMFAIDEALLADLIDEALEDMLAGAGRHAQGLRQVILTGEDEGVGLGGLLDRVEQAATRGGNWLRLNARTIGTALAGKASLEQARALGVMHTQWISRRDDRVRPTHVRADGQVRSVGESFDVGGHSLEYPGDPSGLPATANEVHGCRCGLMFADPDDEHWSALDVIHSAAVDGPDAAGVVDVLTAAVVADQFTPGPPVPGLPGIASVITAPGDVVGWRVMTTVLDVTPGQQVQLPAGTTFGLLAPPELTGAVLAVLVPAGMMVGVAGGALVLIETATMSVLAAGAAGVQGRIVA